MTSLSRLLRRPNSHLLSRSSFYSLSFYSTATATVSQPSTTLKSVLSDIRCERNVDNLVEKFKKSSEIPSFRSKESFYKLIMRRLASSKQFESIESILEHQKKFPDIASEGFASRLICMYGKSNMFSHARKLFDELPQLNCPRTDYSFNALLTAGLESNQYKSVVELFHQLPSEISVKPNAFSYNIVIRAFCKMGSFDSAFSLLESMKKDGVKPDVITYNTLLNELYTGNRFLEAENTWTKMEKEGCVPDIYSYNSKLRGLVAEGKTEEAVKLVNELGDRGIKPDIFSYNALIKGYCNDGKLDEAKKLYKSLKKNAPNRWTFEILISCASEKGDLKFARKLCEASLNRRCTIDVQILQGVVDVLVRESKIEEAKKLVEAGMSKAPYSSSLKLPS